MTFTTMLKEELARLDYGYVESKCELEGFITNCAHFGKDNVTMVLENASVARKIYKDIKKAYNIFPSITIRLQKRFRVKQIYIITVKQTEIIDELLNSDSFIINRYSQEEQVAYLKGAFLAIGNISNPQTSGYHMEFICSKAKNANLIKNLLCNLGMNAKIVKRGYKIVVYLKSSENISDVLKLFRATQSLFFFEDIRIYRDHKNMVNRLNNCELSNQTKSIESGMKQLNDIEYLKDNGLTDILEEKTKIIIDARTKYPESSLTELANIVSLEYNYKIGKSGINHHFIKISNMVKRHKENNKVS